MTLFYKFRPLSRSYLTSCSLYANAVVHFAFFPSYLYFYFIVLVSKSFSSFSFERFLFRRFYSKLFYSFFFYHCGSMIVISFFNYNTIFFLHNKTLLIFINKILNEKYNC